MLVVRVDLVDDLERGLSADYLVNSCHLQVEAILEQVETGGKTREDNNSNTLKDFLLFGVVILLGSAYFSVLQLSH